MQFKDKQLDLSGPQVMGVLNVTPDSFSDGGMFVDPEIALNQARTMVAEGAAIIDVGGESTRPGAADVSEQQELDRVIPIIERIHSQLDTIISIDTSKAAVMSEAVSAGAHMINDVCALRMPDALTTAARLDVPVCVMHMQGKPRTMQDNPQYNDVVKDVANFLQQRSEDIVLAGIPRDRIIIDPGFGFGKTVEHNINIMKHLDEFVRIGFPVLLGVSRKSTIGAILDRQVNERLPGSLALASMAALAGVKIIRTHDVKATFDVLKIIHTISPC